MKVPHKTVRLAEVIQRSGQPEPLTLWTDPQRDPSFRKAIAQKRVLTVKQETVGTRKDFGIVGFLKEENVGYWLFPKSLESFEGKRVIGIKYDLLKTADLKNGSLFEPKKAKRRPPLRTASPPATRKYEISLRLVSSIDTVLLLEAKNKTEARKQALQRKNLSPADFSRGTITRAVLRVQESKS